MTTLIQRVAQEPIDRTQSLLVYGAGSLIGVLAAVAVAVLLFSA